MINPTRIGQGRCASVRLAQTARRFATDCSGATAVEYGLLIAGIALAIVLVVFEIGGSVNGMFEKAQAIFAN
jgi:pilus assembly protein Flp/PilA